MLSPPPPALAEPPPPPVRAAPAGLPAPTVRTAALLVAIVAAAASWNVLLGGFVWDDHQNVEANRWVRDPGRVWEAFTHHLGAYDPSIQSSYYRPVMHVVFAATHAVAGLRPWAYHLVNLLAHALASACVYLLLARWGERRAPADGPARGAEALLAGPLLAALLFAVHPVHAQAVAWIAGIVDLSFSLLALAALLWATREQGSRAWPLVAAPAAFFLALLAKEPAVMLLPVVALALALGGALSDPARRRDALARLGVLCAAFALYLPLRVKALGGLMGSDPPRIRVGLEDGAATALAVLGHYLRLLVAPAPLTPLRGLEVVPGLRDVRALAALAAVAALGLVVWALRRRPGALVGAALLLLPLLPALYVPVLGDNAGAERYAYLPSAGAALLLSAAIDALRARGAAARTAIGVAAAVAFFSFTAATVRHNAVWRDDVTLWSHAVAEVPTSGRAHQALGASLLGAGRTDEAIAALRRAAELLPLEAEPRVNLASALVAAGRADEALAAAEAGARALPRVGAAQGVLGSALAAKGRWAEAIAAYERALALDPTLAEVHNGAAIAWVELGRRDRALVHLREAVRLHPENGRYAENLAWLLRQ